MLTNRSVSSRWPPPPTATARTRSQLPGTRSRILATAAEEFGTRGFAATTGDRIARRARVNKAMILLPLPEQARPLHHDRPRAFHADRR